MVNPHKVIKLFRSLLQKGLSSGYDESLGRKPLFVVSLHKSGTHLITNILELLGLKRKPLGKNAPASSFDSLDHNEYLSSHYNPSQEIFDLIELNRIKVIFHYRDPRDVVVSRFFWQHPQNKIVTIVSREFLKTVHARFQSDQEFLQFIIRGERHMPHEISFVEQFRLSRGLLFHPNVFKTTFETLIGPLGGGERNTQVKTINDLLEYLELEYNPETIADRAFSIHAETFRKGQNSAYRDVFSKETEELFKRLHSDLLRDYGYL